MATKDDFTTRYTGMAMVLATHFKVKFGETDVTGRKPTITQPVGPSSLGGEMARQHINLVREGAETIGIGWVDCAAERCELRNWEYLEAQHKFRHPDERLRMDKKAYADFFVELAHFFRMRDYDVAIPKFRPPPGAERRSAEEATAGGTPGASKGRGASAEPEEESVRTTVLALVLIVILVAGAVTIAFLET